MGRLLIVGADTSSVRAITTAVGKAHEVFTASDRLTAERFVRAIPLDVVIGDAENAEVQWRALRDNLRELTAPAPLPFLFLTPEDEDSQMADLLAGDLLVAVRKPPTGDIVNLVDSLVERTGRKEGALGDTSLAKQILHLASRSGSGLLTVHRGPIAKQLTVTTGHLVDCQSNDPRDQLNMWLIESGLATEDEVKAALREAQGASGQVAGLLGLTGEQLAAVSRQRLREALLDLYLWRIGSWSYFPIKQDNIGDGVELTEIVEEGDRRVNKWDSLQRLFPSDAEVFQWAGELPEDKTLEGGDRRLLDLIKKGKNFGQLLIEFRGRDYALRERLSALFERGLIERDYDAVPTENTEVDQPAIDPFDAVRRKGKRQDDEAPTTDVTELKEPATALTPADAFAEETTEEPIVQTQVSRKDGDSAIETVLAIAEEHLDNGDIQAALECYEDVLRLDPTNAAAMLALAELDEITTGRAKQAGITPDAVVSLAQPLESLLDATQPLPHTHAFILSRLVSGAMMVQDLQTICPITEAEVLEILQHYADAGVLDISR